jgi:thiamine pyrophosphate-dependent acetolactate synthase large subunit-like protein
MLSRSGAIRNIFEKHGNEALYITNTGYLSRAVHNMYPDDKNILYMQGSMGLSPAIALGVAKNTDKDVIAFVGDASLLMHLGITHTIRDEALDNLFIYVLDNGCHESVGKYKCSSLESEYVGITEIVKISNDGKMPRVTLGCVENADNIKGFLSK